MQLHTSLTPTDYIPATTQALDPLHDTISSVELVRVSGSDLDIVNAARVSYGKISRTVTDRDRALIEYLIAHHHTSPLEHNQLSFRIKAPIYVARQWMRHRMNSYNEISYRYVKAPLEFYIPTEWRYQDATNRQCSTGTFTNDALRDAYRQSITMAAEQYEHLLAAGVARELARGLLPLCTYTEFIYTCNLHSLFNFLTLRLAAGAQHEIRAYAEALLMLAGPHFPIAIAAWQRLQSTR